MLRTVITGFSLLLFIVFRADAEEPNPVLEPQASSNGESIVVVTLKLDPDATFRGDAFYEATDICAEKKGLPAEVEGPCGGPDASPFTTCSVESPFPLGDGRVVRAGVVDFQPLQPDVKFQVTVEAGDDGGGNTPGIQGGIRFVVRCLEIYSEGIDEITAIKIAQSAYRTVFVSSETYTGDLGGIAGADEKCNSLAQAAGLLGTYRAWISDADANGDPIHWRHSSLPFIRTDGVTVAESLNDVTDCLNPTCLKDKINVDENGHSAELPLHAWTFVKPTGWGARDLGHPLDYYQSCRNWTSSERSTYRGLEYGLLGDLASIESDWTYKRGYRQTCDRPAHLYCFQQ